ncbi:MAG: DUF4097 family beta strand repeat-containing protein [Fimbriimonadaceae bacterium]
MKEEISRIMKMVQEGKLTPEDAAELIDAFQSDRQETAATPPSEEPKTEQAQAATGDKKTGDPFQGVVDFIENIGREVTHNVNWQEISSQVRTGANKGFEALKKAAEEIKAGQFNITVFGTAETRDIALPLTVGEGKIVKVENPCGNIKVTGGHETGSVNARVKISGSSTEDAKAKADNFTLVIEESEQHVLIRQPKQNGLSVDIVVQLASKCAIELKTDSGDIEIRENGGNIKVASQSGDLKIANATGSVDISAQSGDTTIADSENANISLESKSGHIAITNVSGNLNARCASGELAVKNWTGKILSVESVTGDVSVDIATPVAGTINIRTVNGDASVSIADGGDARVSLSTLRGTVTSSVALEDEARGDQRVTGKLGDGAGTLDVSGINGDINFKLRDSVATG